MSQRVDIAAVAIGGSMAAGPAMVDVPFYESNIWLSCVAILGMTVLVLAAANGILTIRKKLKSDGNVIRSNR